MNLLHSTLASILNESAALPDVPPWLLDSSSSTPIAGGGPGPGDDDDDDDDVGEGNIEPDEDEGYDDEEDDDDDEEPLRCARPPHACERQGGSASTASLRRSIP